MSFIKHVISRLSQPKRSRRSSPVGVPEQLEVRALLDGTGTILDITLTDPADIFTDVPPPLELPPLIDPTLPDIAPTDLPVLTIPTIDLDTIFADDGSGFGLDITASLGVVPPDTSGGVIPPGFDDAADATSILTDITLTFPPITVPPGIDIIISIGISTTIPPVGPPDPTINIGIEIPF